MLDFLSKLRDRWRLRQALKSGLKMGRSVRIIGRQDFGSEPYLIEIGDYVTVSSNVTFLTHDGATWVFRRRPDYEGLQRFGRIKIGSNCFIGAGAIIMPGVRIGNDCVIGAGSVVTRSVPDGSVVVGSPARYVCSYDEYVERAAPRCGHYPAEIASDGDKLRRVLLATLPEAGAAEIESVEEATTA